MRRSNRTLVALSLFSVVLVSLYACGGGGGGGGTPPLAPLSVGGTVTDSDRAPVSGATVTVYNGTGTAVATVASNAAGAYEVRGLAAGTYTLAASGPVGTFPTELYDLDLTSGTPPTVDIYLPSTSPAVETAANSEIYSQTDLANNYTVTLDLSASTEIGALTEVDLKPVDVSQFGTGQAAVVGTLAVADPADYVTQWYAAAAVKLVGATIDGTGNPAVLTLPVPLPFQNLATPTTASLFRLNETTMAWEEVDADASVLGIDPATLDSSVVNAWFYQADVFLDGYYRVGFVNSATDQVTGTVTYDGVTPVPGATVYLNGADYGYQQVVTTAADGTFSGFALDGMLVDATACRKQGGVQMCTAVTGATPSTDTFDLGNFILPLTPGVSTVTLTVADDTEIGIVGVSGRTYTDAADIAAYADIAFQVSTFFDVNGEVYAYADFSGGATLNGGGTTLLVSGPTALTVVTPAGHTVFATVTDVQDIGLGMEITLSIAFVP